MPSLTHSHLSPLLDLHQQQQQKLKQSTSTSATTTTKLSVHKRVRFGESVLAVGSSPALGAWDPTAAGARGGALRWSEGDVWTGELPSAGEEGTEFKFVVVREGGEVVEWEGGGNRVLSAASAASGAAVGQWGETGEKKRSSASSSSSTSSSSRREAAKAREAAASAPSPLGLRGGGGGGNNVPSSSSSSSSSPPALAPGGAAWVGAAARFMRSNEHSGDRGQGIRWDHDRIDDEAAGGPASRSFVEGDERAASFLAKLELTKSVLSPSSLPKGKGPGLDAVAAATVYLSLVNSGALPCAEAGGHARPSRHAAASRVVFRALEWGIGDPGQAREAAALSRRLHARLPSFADDFTAATPLTRVRDLAHRNDIPQELKQEIKHTIQNKLHRNAGPEDLVATESLLARLKSARHGTCPDAFLREFELFALELREFFNASELEDMLRGLTPSLDASGEQVIDRVLGCKRAADSLLPLPLSSSPSASLADPEATSHLNVLVDALHAATTARALLASGLSSGLRTDAPDSSLSMRQRWRVADARLEDYVFVLLSRCASAVEGRCGGSAGLSRLPIATGWSLPLGALLLAVRNVGLSGWADVAECMAVESELVAWRASAGAEGAQQAAAESGSAAAARNPATSPPPPLSAREASLRLKATAERALRLAGGVSDDISAALTPRAGALGGALGLSERTKGFAESEVRASVAFQLARLAQVAAAAARAAAGSPPWDAIVTGKAAGEVISVEWLGDAPALIVEGLKEEEGGSKAGNEKGKKKEKKFIVLAQRASGDEEVGAAAGPGGPNVAGVLVAADLPHLSHLGVRARQERLPFAACADAGLVGSEVDPFVGKRVRLHVTADGVKLKLLPPWSSAADAAAAAPGTPSFAAEEAGGDWSDDELVEAASSSFSSSSASCLSSSSSSSSSSASFAAPSDTSSAEPDPLDLSAAKLHTCGAKAAACGALLRASAAPRAAFAAAAGFVLPYGALRAAAGFVLPYGALRAAAEDAGKSREFDAALSALDAAADGAELEGAAANARRLVASLRPRADALSAAVEALLVLRRRSRRGKEGISASSSPPPPRLLLAVRSSAAAEDLAGASAAGLYDSVLGVDPSSAEQLGDAVAAVWASLFSRRAVLARRGARLSPSKDYAAMAVIVQEMAPAALSFVLHTKAPGGGGNGEEEGGEEDNRKQLLAAEVAVGAGEALASAESGSPWRLSVDRATGAVEVSSFANLSRALLPSSSSSSSSDSSALSWRCVDYSRQTLSLDPVARERLAKKLLAAGLALEASFGGPQDVEGCLSEGLEEGGEIWIVQARPQPGV